MKTRWLVCLWLFGIGIGAWSSQADARWLTDQALGKAREALSLGLLDKWKQALLQGEAYFAQERTRMSLQTRTNTAMWLQLLWAKYYQYMGILPPIRDVSSFEDQKALQAFIKQFDKATAYLRRSRHHLRQYNSLYTQAMDRTKLRSQVYLQASLSLSRDLEERIRSSKIYLAFLRYAHKNWGNQQKIQKQLNKQQLDINTHKRDLQRAIQRQQTLQSQQQKLANSVKVAQDNYQRLEARLSSQKTTSITLLTIGSIITAGGLGVLGYSIYRAVHLDYLYGCGDKDEPSCLASKRPNAEETRLSIEEQQTNNYILLASMGGAVAIGTVLIIIGAVTLPKKGAVDDAVIKSHNKHLEHERKQSGSARDTRSQVPRLQLRRQGQIWHIAATPAPSNAHVLGRW